jgi:hypothetical protein
MGEAKRRKQLDPNYGKPLPPAVKYLVDYIKTSFRGESLKGNPVEKTFFPITNSDKGFTVEERQLIADNRHLFAKYHVAVMHAGTEDIFDIYIPNQEPIFNANEEIVSNIIREMCD